MFRRTLLLAATAVLLALPTAGHAKNYHATYVVPSPPGVLFTPPVCTPDSALGGCAFELAAGERRQGFASLTA